VFDRGTSGPGVAELLQRFFGVERGRPEQAPGT
jgi:hypothetical protein